MEEMFFTCVSLSQTQEAKLTEVQRSLHLSCKHPSCFALPPIYIVFFHTSYEHATEIWESGPPIQLKRAFTLSSLVQKGDTIVAEPDPPLQLPASSIDAARQGLHSYPSLGGFYVCETNIPLSSIIPVDFPSQRVRSLRWQIFRINSVEPQGRWWRGIEWSIEKERWIKLSDAGA